MAVWLVRKQKTTQSNPQRIEAETISTHDYGVHFYDQAERVVGFVFTEPGLVVVREDKEPG